VSKVSRCIAKRDVIGAGAIFDEYLSEPTHTRAGAADHFKTSYWTVCRSVKAYRIYRDGLFTEAQLEKIKDLSFLTKTEIISLGKVYPSKIDDAISFAKVHSQKQFQKEIARIRKMAKGKRKLAPQSKMKAATTEASDVVKHIVSDTATQIGDLFVERFSFYDEELERLGEIVEGIKRILKDRKISTVTMGVEISEVRKLTIAQESKFEILERRLNALEKSSRRTGYKKNARNTSSHSGRKESRQQAAL